MDVRCERCRAQYVFDDAQVTEAGLTVKCSNCGHLFRVKKKALVVTVPVKPGEATDTPVTGTAVPPTLDRTQSSPPGSTPPGSPLAGEKREWRVRQANGNVFTFKELTTLQKWIVEKKVTRDDEISLSGDQWKRLGNIAELATFFQVVEAAERGQAGPLPALTPLPMPPPVYPSTGAYPLGYPPGFPPGYPQATPVPLQPGAPPPVTGSIQVNVGAPPGAAWESQPPAAPRAGAPEPAWTAGGRRALPDAEVDDQGRKAVKGGGGKLALLVLLLAVAGGAAAWLLKPEWLVAMGLKAPPPPPPPAPAAVQAPPPAKPEPPAPAPAPAPTPAPAATPSPAATLAPEPPKAEAPPAPLEKAPQMVKEAPPPAHPRGVKQMLAEAQRLRERGKVEKALDLYGRIVEQHPGNAAALAGRGWCYLDLSQYPPAEASFQAALEEDATHGEALIGLAETYRYQGRRAEAVGYYQKYLAAHPDGEDAVAARNALGQLKE